MIRRFGDRPKASRSYRMRQGVYAILPLNESLLLTAQYADDPDIQLPGGGIDADEHPLAALHREVMEETGWTIAYPRRLGAFRRFVFMPEYDLWAEKLCTVYIAQPVMRKCDPTEPDHSEIWADPETAVNILGNDGDRHFLRQVINRTRHYTRGQ